MRGHGDCQCGHGGHHHHGMRSHGPGRGWRRFVAPSEEREHIEHYISELEKEIAGARARLAELQDA